MVALACVLCSNVRSVFFYTGNGTADLTAAPETRKAGGMPKRGGRNTRQLREEQSAALREQCKAYAPVVAQSKRRYDDVTVVISARIYFTEPCLNLDGKHEAWMHEQAHPLPSVECHALHVAIVRKEANEQAE